MNAIARRQFRWLDLSIVASLVAATLAVYLPVSHYEFVNYDDPVYVFENNHVRTGLTLAGTQWAFTTTAGGNWFPITWLSHMADVQYFGLRSGAHHVTNLILHLLSTFLLFVVFRRMTGACWPSAFVAFVFALHPLHVESVAWIAERKDVLSAFFWMITLLAWVWYTERTTAGRYALVLLAFCFALMSKSMVVTLPFVLLLLDIWPLSRTPRPQDFLRSRVFWEKVPLLILAASLSVATFLAQRAGGAIASFDEIPFGVRLANAPISYVTYLSSFLWPSKLAAFYPYPPVHPLWTVLAAVLILLAISALVLVRFHQNPYLAVGWLWYAVTLVPVIGLIQVGAQSHADRYTYLPLIGVSVGLAWGLAELTTRWASAKAFIIVIVGWCTLCSILTRRQVSYWQDSESLFRHAVSVTSDNAVAQANLGDALMQRNRPAEALEHLREGIRIRPNIKSPYIDAGKALRQLGKLDEAVANDRLAAAEWPNDSDVRLTLGIALSEQGHMAEALEDERAAVRLDPESADARYNLGTLYATLGRIDEASAQLREAIRLQPELAEAHFNLGNVFAGLGDMAGAIAEYSTAIRLDPADFKARNNLGSVLASAGRYDAAIEQFAEVVRLRPDEPEFQRNLREAQALRDAEKSK